MNAAAAVGGREVRLGLRKNAAQFSLLVLINAFVGLMVGLERAVLPLIGKQSFHLTSDVAVLTYLIAFGLAKAFTNLAAGALAARVGRRRLLIAGWAAALPVPFLIGVAPSWAWVVAANVFLGINQGLAWSDKIGRKPLIVAGMLLQGAALGVLALSGGNVAIATATAVFIGLGTALVYPTLIAAMSDAVSPVERAPVVGVYRFWRDSGYAFGGLIAGATADALGYGGAIAIIAALTAASGLWVLGDMPQERRQQATSREVLIR